MNIYNNLIIVLSGIGLVLVVVNISTIGLFSHTLYLLPSPHAITFSGRLDVTNERNKCENKDVDLAKIITANMRCIIVA